MMNPWTERGGDRAGALELPPDAYLDRLELLELHGRILTVLLTYFVGQALPGLRGSLGIPGKRASFEAEFLTTLFRRDRSLTLDLVKRFDCSEMLHGDFLLCRGSPDWPSRG